MLRKQSSSSQNRWHKILFMISALVICFALIIAIGVIGTSDQKSSTSFNTCFGILLFLIACGQVYVLVMLILNRRNPSIELFQPRGLVLFVMAGIFATISCFTLVWPEYNPTCSIRQPIILTCISIMGSILVARCWRITCIISPSTTFASASDNADILQAARMKCMNILTKLSQLSTRKCKKSIKDSSIRQQITFTDSMRLASALMIPQLILQILNVSVPSMRMRSIDLDDGMHTCQSDTDIWLLIVGIVVASIPFFLSLLLNIRSVGIPAQLSEYNEIKASILTSISILVVTLPVAAMVKDVIPTAHAYLMAASVLSFVLPLCYNIAWGKMNSKVTMDDVKSKRRGSGKGDVESELSKAAEKMAIMGSMFERMGNSTKALDIDRDILSLFKADEEFAWESGFDDEDISSLGPKSLGIIVSTMIGGAKRWHKIYLSNTKEREEARNVSLITCNGALAVFRQSNSKHSMKDRSVVFPGYSFMNMMIKMMGKDFESLTTNQTRDKFEIELVNNFLEETTFQQYNHCRALAMMADVLRRHGRYEEAIASIETMRSMYNPRIHSRIILEVYASDHCADMFAASIYWRHYLDRTDEAVQLCDYVAEQIIPEIRRDELLSLTYILLPIVCVLKDQGQDNATKALELYTKHITSPLRNAGKNRHPAVTTISPVMLVILNCRSSIGRYKGMEDDISWLLDGDENKVPVWLETASITYVDWTLT